MDKESIEYISEKMENGRHPQALKLNCLHVMLHVADEVKRSPSAMPASSPPEGGKPAHSPR